MNVLKEVSYGSDCKDAMINGVNTIADAVGSTMGALGNLVLIETDGALPKISKDGYNTAQSIHLENPIESLACELIKEASQKTVDEAGDSTTATCVLAQAFVLESHKATKNGKSPIIVKEEIEASTEKVLAYIKEHSKPVTDELLYNVALTSSNGDKEVAKIVSDAFIKAGSTGSVGCFRSEDEKTSLDFIEATLLETGYMDDLFINVNVDRTVRFDNSPLVVFSEITFKTWAQIEPFVKFAAENNREILFVSDMEFQVRDLLIRNKLNGAIKVSCTYPAGFGQRRRDILADLAMVGGTNVITTTAGDHFAGREAEFIGEMKSIVSGKSDTLFYAKDELDREAIEGKIAEFKEVAKKTSNQYEKNYMQERIARLSSRASIIKIGGLVPSEVEEKLDRADDAIGSVKSAIEEGVIIGGGMLLKNAADFIYGLDDVTKEALQAPFRRILKNADIVLYKPKWYEFWKSETGVNLSPSRSTTLGYDVRNRVEVDMFEAGIVDSAKAIRNAYMNAKSVSNTILRVNYNITNKRMTNGK